MSGPPPTWRVFRTTWAALHLLLLLVVTAAVVAWSASDSHGADLLQAWASWAGSVQSTLSHALPFPWETGS